MWSNFVFNKPYDGISHEIINGAGELLGMNEDGKYFIVPDMLEEEYLTIIGERMNLPGHALTSVL